MLDLELLDELREQRQRAQAEANRALTAAFDEIQRAYETGERVNVKRAAELLGVTRQDIYRELDRRGVERLRAA